MAYDTKLADKVRQHLIQFPKLQIEEKKMFAGLAFLINGKMCVNISRENLMIRFDPALQEIVAEKAGFKEMIMKGRVYKGYCYINPEGIKSKKNFDYFLNLCLDFNKKAKASKKKKT